MTFTSLVRSALIGASFAVLTMTSAQALTQTPYNDAAFKAAQAEGKPVVVHVTAPWCGTCKAQHQALDSLANNPLLKTVSVYTVDFDSQGDVWKSFNARSQSTIIAFAGNKETGRIVGETGAKAIETLLQSSLAK